MGLRAWVFPTGGLALTAQLQTAVAEQLVAQDKAHRVELQELAEECRASAHDARLAKAQLQDQKEEIENFRQGLSAGTREQPSSRDLIGRIRVLK